MPFISVVIPVYKVEKYIEQCVVSVLNQKLDDIEIILVDDGSPDKCPLICDEFARKENCVKVIHKPNGGLSTARNAGIDAASGQYLIFMDSDDWWNPDVNMRQVIAYVNEHKQTEMFLFTSLDYLEGQGYYKRAEHNRLDQISTVSLEEYYQSLLNNGNLEVSANTKIIRTEFIKKNNLYFKPGLLGEDNEWMLRLLRQLRSVDLINEPIYVCRMNRPGSISNTIGLKNISDLLDIVSGSIRFYQENSSYNALKDKELCYAAYLWFSALGLSASLSAADKKKVKPQFKATNCVCNYSNSGKTKLCYRLYRVVGLRITTMILGTYIGIKQKYNLNKTKTSE